MRRAIALVFLMLPVLAGGARASTAEADTVSLRFLLHLPLVEVTINGTGPYRMIFDTGAAVCVLTERLAEELDVPILGTTEVSSPAAGGTVEVDSAAVDALQVGTLQLDNVHAIVLNLDRMLGPGMAPDGILGLRAFAGYVVEVDYHEKRLLVHSGELPEPDGDTVFGYDEGQWVPSIPVAVAGVDIDVDLDTGAPSLLVLPLRYASRLPLESEPKVTGRGMVVGGGFEIRSAGLSGDVRIGRHSIETPTIAFADGATRANAGYQLMGRYVFSFDPANRRVALKARE